MRWATRAGVHIDRAASAWLLRRFVDPSAEFVFVTDPDDVPEDATPFDMRGVEYGHQVGPTGVEECTFETILRRHDLLDPALWRVAAVIHEADIEDATYDAPEAPGLDVVLRGLSLSHDDGTVLSLSGPVFDALYEYHHRALLLGRSNPA